ncbi:MAG: flagellar basal body-associated FliL family protein [Deltaproteobacteria bacterium]|nr:flagellar basal body-associated FliL family protein [Deltaproteobacteria bacterium]
MAKTVKKTEIDLLTIDPSRAGKEEPAAADPSENKAPGRFKRFSFVIYMLAGMLIISGGIMASVLLGWVSISSPVEQPTKIKTTASAVSAKPAQKPREIGPTIKLNALVINLNEPDGSHFIKTSMVLELEKAEYLEEIQSRTALLIDTAILALGDQHLSDLRNPDYKDQLKKVLTGKMNQRLQAQKIKQLYFDEFLYQ